MKLIPIALILSLAALGCGREYADNTPTAPATSKAVESTATVLPTARVSGVVTWPGELPLVPPINGLVRTGGGSKWENKPNHFAPVIDPKSRGVAGAVVWLQGVDPAKAKPWPFPPLTVEVRGSLVQARQGETVGRFGFVRTGDEVTLTSADDEYHMLRARGASFFTLPFPTPNQPVRRKLGRPGHVEFASGTGYFWSAAEVFVCDHPYFAVTDAEGRFRFDNVPPGKLKVGAWLRNWHITDADRDPETGRTMRLTFAAPFTTSAPATATADADRMTDVPLPFPTDTGAKR